MIKSGYAVEQTRLTGTVWPDNGMDLPIVNLGIHPGQRRYFAEIDVNIFKLQQNFVFFGLGPV